MTQENYLINVVDSESSLGWAIADTISVAQKIEKPVIACVRGITCLITKDTTIEAGIARYRRAAERLERVRN